jgi:hypothetical protein
MNKLQELEIKLKEAQQEAVKIEEKLRKEEIKQSKDMKLMYLNEDFEIIETTLSDLGLRYDEKKYEKLKAGDFEHTWKSPVYKNCFFEKDKNEILKYLISEKSKEVKQDQESIQNSKRLIEKVNKEIDILEKLKENK